jgi:ATP-dependent Zn protease
MNPSDSDHDSDNEQLRRYTETPEIRSLTISHESGHAVLAEYFGHELRDVDIKVVIISTDGMADGATGGSTTIGWKRLDINGPDFDEQIQEAATILMGGRAAEELTHSELAQASSWALDILQFKDKVKEWRTETEMDAILEEGYQTAKMLLRTKLSEQHNRLRSFLATEPALNRPNGRFLCRAMKGLSP